ncbi:MAG: 16S rRNA (guanine(527)-N(7))-methyltransferase RsmG [Armatimonadota bacterium]|nr:16S rRNA (guanine(527)-N(7))-methyltransferase RsmG [Armatimonadota bacterium]MDR7451087.1 16S rRNA (guanine(527)-N(7))-methyltransferase RsmG [Armatimonadota bacterium]MDR7465892.1 16S rRNA (guanine(527)-N(7))-methyltransferase RsmG [Armatimonadota bacterium]MDR7493957.1 16S rRNA (guanine(527)-N(7))-methyltransferase RsmG [Armatimonadota bacterium]MDR7498407.1 16S rRNA (guanine(527)-N(7))-methyltransferase RsmG [Armatimonadota bacterium]
MTADRVYAALRSELGALGMTPSRRQLELFVAYLGLIARWRARARLTAIADPISAARLHIADSLLCLAAGIPEGAELVDVGSGAGLPGIPLVIAREDLRITLLEAEARRAAFLETAVDELGLQARVVCARAEDAGRGQLRERFDVAVARAVARLPLLYELTLPLVRVGGRVILLKGVSVRAELARWGAAVRVLGGGEPRMIDAVLKGGEGRILVVVEKETRTPDTFPRRGGALRRPILNR